MVRARVRVRVSALVRVRVGDAVVRNAVGRKVGNHKLCLMDADAKHPAGL